MGIDFDINEYVKSLKNAEPPFKCAVEGCEKNYRFVVYIYFHLKKNPFLIKNIRVSDLFLA